MRPTHKASAHMRPTHKAPAEMRPTHEAAADEHAPGAEAGIGVEVVGAIAVVAAIRPPPTIPVMRPTRPAMDLVDEAGVLDGGSQAVGATERDGSGRFGDKAGGHDGCGRNGEYESPHGFPPEINVPTAPRIARSDDLYQALAQPFVANAFILHSCVVTFFSCAESCRSHLANSCHTNAGGL